MAKKQPKKAKYTPIRLPGKGKIPLSLIRKAVRAVRRRELEQKSQEAGS